MRNTILILLISTFQVFAAGSYAQTKKLNLDMKNTTIKEVLSAIEDQSEFYFLYNSELIDVTRKVDVEIEGEKVDQILARLFDKNKVDFLVKDRYIVLTPVGGNAELFAEQQQPAISGTVTEESGEPLPGVTVVVKGTTRGTVTNADGGYSITNIPEDATLVFSFVGMRTQEVEVGNQTTIDVTMEIDAIGIEEVVAIGYGTQNKRDVSTAISSVTSKALDDKPVANFTRAIAGEMAGVRVLNSNNAPGGGTNIKIRGVSSISASNDPLIVIDGFPLKDGFGQNENPLNFINPNDIESIEVLKDASSSAIYGAQAANGVILITTKKGKVGKPTINISVSSGMESMLNPMDMLNREDFLQFLDDSRAQAYVVEDPNWGTDNPDAPMWSWSDSDETRIYNWRHFSSMSQVMGNETTLYERWAHVTEATKAQPYNTDWQDEVTRVGQIHNLQLSLNGGNDNVLYMASGGFFKQEGILSATGYDRFSFRSNIELKINDWMKAGLLLAPSLERLSVTNVESTFYDIVRTPPIYPVYDENGDRAYLGLRAAALPPLEDWTQWNLADMVNPLERDQIKDDRRTVRNLATIFGEAEIINGLTLRTELHTEFKNWERNYFLPSSYPTTDISRTTRSRGSNQIDSRFYWNSQSYLTFKRDFGIHSVNAILGYTAQESSYRNTYLLKYDYPSDYISTLNQALTVLNQKDHVRTNRSSESAIGSFARILYNYGGKYYLTTSVRRDGSSKFGSKRKWGTFPSLSSAWRISDETFFSPLTKFINDLKIRGGWGVIGNSGIGNYNALATLESVTYVLGSGSSTSAGYQDGRVPNPKLGWETTTDFGLGADVLLFDNRISLSVDYFYKITEDMLFSIPLPRITGFDSYIVNIGSMRNRGYEYKLTTRNFVGEFNWTTSFNLSYYRNRVLDTGKDKRPLITGQSYTVENKPLAGLYGYANLGPYRDWEDVKTSPIVNPENIDWMFRSAPGTPKLADVNGDGKIDSSDQTIIGTPNPDFIWGMTNNLSCKGFDLSVLVNGVQGGDILNQRLEGIMARANGTANVNYEYYNNYWRPDRTDAKYAAPTRKSWDGTPVRGTLLFKQTYVNISNIVLGYTLSRNLTQRWDMSKLRLYASVQNAFMFTDYPGYNPEVNQSGNSALSQAVDAGSYPLTRIISLGINVSL